MDITGVSSDGKERLITQEYSLTLPQYREDNRRSKCIDLFRVMLTVISVAACVTACVCAIYCYQILADQQKVQYVNDANSGVSAPFVASTATPGESDRDVDVYIDSDADFDTEFYDWDDSETDDYSEEEYDDIVEDLDEDVDEYGSGFISDTDSEGHSRVRRAASDCAKRCSKKKNRKRCLTKCEKGGQKKQPANLAAAHFEVRLSEDEIKNLVRVEHNSYVNKETCKHIESMEGKLCLNRTFYPQKSNVPLNIFKPAPWVDSKTSPVKFNNSIAQTKSAGIFMVYAQVYIGGKGSQKSISIVQKRMGKEITALSCNNGVHPDHFDSISGQKQTCSVIGLLHVQEDDTIEMQMSRRTMEVVLDKDKTYFGLVQVSTFVENGGKKKKAKKNSKN